MNIGPTLVKSLCYISGIAYVTYSKASEAALAIEEMNGQSILDRQHVKVKDCLVRFNAVIFIVCSHIRNFSLEQFVNYHHSQ